MLEAAKEQLLNYYKQVSHTDAPHLMKAIDDLAKHPMAGEKSKFAKVYVLKKEFDGAHPMLDYLAGCMHHKGENILVMGREIMHDMGVHSLKTPITEELKAVIAHEMGHALHGDMKPWGVKTWSNLSPLIGMVGGLAGAYAVKKIMEKHPDDKEKQACELAKTQEVLKCADNGSFGLAAKVALYTAGAGLGLVAGLFGAKALNYKMEFRADEASKILMGGGEALVSALKKLGTSMAELKGVTIPKHAHETEVLEALDRSRNALEAILHPPMSERIKALRR